MCGRIAIRHSRREIEESFDARFVDDSNRGPSGSAFVPRFNLAPTEFAPVVYVSREADSRMKDARIITPMVWGFIPSGEKSSRSVINARCEGIESKPLFRSEFARQRCLIAADAFYEWKRSGGVSRPYLIEMNDARPFGIAAIWKDVAGQHPRCCVLTTSANDLVSEIHDRMPVIILREDYATWLSPETPLEAVRSLLRPIPADLMHIFAVSSAVNRSGYDAPDCVSPVDTSNDPPQSSLF